MLEHPALDITVLIALAAVGVGVGVFSTRRRRRVRRLCAAAASALGQRRHGEALGLLLKAERDWAFNAHDGGRTSLLADLNDFSTVLELLGHSSPPANEVQIKHLRTVVAELRDLLAERANFGMDGRTMKRETALRWVELSDRFQMGREELRMNHETTKTAV